MGRTARYLSGGRSVLFLAPTETKMVDKLQEKKIPIRFIKVCHATEVDHTTLLKSNPYCLPSFHRDNVTVKYMHISVQANTKRLESVSGSLAALLVKYPNLQSLAQRAFITYLKSIQKHRDKELFDVTKLPIDEFSASIGLPMTPKVRFVKQIKGKKVSEDLSIVPESRADDVNPSELLKGTVNAVKPEKAEPEVDESFLLEKKALLLGEDNETDNIQDV